MFFVSPALAREVFALINTAEKTARGDVVHAPNGVKYLQTREQGSRMIQICLEQDQVITKQNIVARRDIEVIM